MCLLSLASCTRDVVTALRADFAPQVSMLFSGEAFEPRTDGFAAREVVFSTRGLVTWGSVQIEESGLVGAAFREGDALAFEREGGLSWWTHEGGHWEEWLYLRHHRGGLVARWSLRGARARQSGDDVEVVDGEGHTRLVVRAPRAWAGAVAVPVRLIAEGDALSAWVDATGPLLVDPIWSAVGAMTTARTWHFATLLPTGEVLAGGGYASPVSSSQGLASTELYEPTTGKWVATAPMSTGRGQPTATLLTNGQVLVAGGYKGQGNRAIATAELFDPKTKTWRATTGPLFAARGYHTATRLLDGRVLLAAGWDGASIGTAELYSPSTGVFTATGSLATTRNTHGAVLLNTGKVLVSGGRDAAGNYLASCELWDPATGVWTATGAMASPRQRHTLTVLPSGKVLAAGGKSNAGALASAELYDPATGTWSATASMSTPRNFAMATSLPDGTVLMTGGWDGAADLASAETYDATSGTWSPAPAMAAARDSFSATMLASGRVLIAGGATTVGLSASEEYAPTTGLTRAAGTTTAREFGTLTPLRPGGVLFVGGTGATSVATVERYDPSGNTWSMATSLTTARKAHSATLLADGRVLVAGGSSSTSTTLASAEVFDSSNTWSTGGTMTVARTQHTATLLPSGKVLVAGGAMLASAELFDPVAGGWTGTGAMASPHALHTATLLLSGKVLVAGGLNGSNAVTTCALYDPSLGTWSPTGSLATARAEHTATLLPDGRVLVIGGSSGVALASAELYDPALGTWSPAGTLTLARTQHIAMVLPNGRVLVAGGNAGVTSTELYDVSRGTFAAGPALQAARSRFAAARIPSGAVLLAGGAATAELFDENRGAQASSTPTLTLLSLPDTNPGGTLTLAGTLFTGITEGSGGRHESSPSNFPVVVFTRVDNGARTFGALASFTSNSVTVALAPGIQPGLHGVRVVVNGVASAEASLLVPVQAGLLPLGASCASGVVCASGSCVDSVCCQSVCAGGACQACSVARGATANGTCTVLSAGTACGATSCSGTAETRQVCDGVSPVCMNTMIACVAYVCGATACLSTCTSTTECQPGLVCNNSVCEPPDAGVVVDAGVVDAGVVDAGVADAGVVDAGEVDAGEVDAGDSMDGGPEPQRRLNVGFSCSSTDVTPWLLCAGLWFARRRHRRSHTSASGPSSALQPQPTDSTR